MSLLDRIREKAANIQKKIVLPESDDARTIEAINYILDNRISRLILIGKDDVRDKIRSKNQDGVVVVDPEKYDRTEKFIQDYFELRKAKGITPEEARDTVKNDWVTFGAMLVKSGAADGFVAGANHTSSDVIRTALRCLQMDKTIGVISGAFVMEMPDKTYGENGIFLFADCGVNPTPNSRQLAGIAVSSATLFKKLVGAVPRVAMLSFSSKGSASGQEVEKVAEAVKKAREMAPDLLVDGEFQLDSAIVPEVANIKCPGGEVAGKANVLIFPDLNAGNICYKMTQRLAKARAVGPLLQGLTRPCSDLSRGCSWEDIVDAVAVTALRS